MKASIRRMLGYAPQAMYLTHYGRVGQVEKLADDLFEQIDAMAPSAANAMAVRTATAACWPRCRHSTWNVHSCMAVRWTMRR